MLLAPSYACPGRKFKSSQSCEQFGNNWSASAFPVAEVRGTKHRILPKKRSPSPATGCWRTENKQHYLVFYSVDTKPQNVLCGSVINVHIIPVTLVKTWCLLNFPEMRSRWKRIRVTNCVKRICFFVAKDFEAFTTKACWNVFLKLLNIFLKLFRF